MAHFNYITKLDHLHAILSEELDENIYIVKIERAYALGYKQVIVISDITWEVYHSDFTYSSYQLANDKKGERWRLVDVGKWNIDKNKKAVIKKPLQYNTNT